MSDAGWDEPVAAEPAPEISTEAKELPVNAPSETPEEEVVNPPGAGTPAGVDLTPSEDGTEEGPSGPRYKVEPPAERFEWHGLVIGPEFTAVPAEKAAPLESAASDAGVTLTPEG